MHFVYNNLYKSIDITCQSTILKVSLWHFPRRSYKMRVREGPAKKIDPKNICDCGGYTTADYKHGNPARRCLSCEKIWYYTTCFLCDTHLDERLNKVCNVCKNLHCPTCGSCDPSGECTCEGSCWSMIKPTCEIQEGFIVYKKNWHLTISLAILKISPLTKEKQIWTDRPTNTSANADTFPHRTKQKTAILLVFVPIVERDGTSQPASTVELSSTNASPANVNIVITGTVPNATSATQEITAAAKATATRRTEIANWQDISTAGLHLARLRAADLWSREYF